MMLLCLLLQEWDRGLWNWMYDEVLLDSILAKLDSVWIVHIVFSFFFISRDGMGEVWRSTRTPQKSATYVETQRQVWFKYL